MRRVAILWAVFVSMSLSLVSVRAEDYRYAWSAALGPADTEENFGLLGEASDAFLLTLGFQHRLSRHLMGEVEVGVSGREHSVADGLLPDDPTLSLSWLAYSLAVRLRIGRFEPFLAAGIGAGQAELDLVDEGVPPVRVPVDDDAGLVLLYRAGFDVALRGRSRLGIEYREIDFEGELGTFTEGNTQLGGSAVALTYRYTFGR